jgi:hypothetical protein
MILTGGVLATAAGTLLSNEAVLWKEKIIDREGFP